MSNEDLPAFADLVQALGSCGHAVLIRADANGAWEMAVVDKDGRRLPAALGVAGHASLHRALDTWRRRHAQESAS